MVLEIAIVTAGSIITIASAWHIVAERMKGGR